MFFGYLALVAFLFVAVLFGWNFFVNGWKRRDCYDPNASMIFSTIFGVLGATLLFIGLINSLNTNSNQVGRSMELAKIDSSESIYKAKADNLTKEFAGYLAEAYPQYEKDIFSKIEPGKVDLYMVKYPELQASKTLTELVKQVRDLQDKVYEQQLARVQIIRDMKFAVLDPWVYQWVMPDIPVSDK